MNLNKKGSFFCFFQKYMLRCISILKIKTKKMNTITFWEKYYIHSIVITTVLFFFYLLWMNNSFLYSSILDYKNIVSDTFDGTVSPIEFVPDPLQLSYEQRKQKYEDIDSKYFIKAPEYNPNIFGRDLDALKPGTKEHAETITQRLIYTVPYIGTYNFDYKEFSWSHPGIDIVVPEGTPIRNISAWVVVDVGFQWGGFGNFVLIKHNNVLLPSGEKGNLYSLYAHMLKSIAPIGTKIKKWEVIGYVGQSWTATTPHLHFQIDVQDAPYSPYWPFSSADMKWAQVWFFQWVNIGLWKENAIKYTINPLKFVNDHLNNSIPLASNQTEENNQEDTKEEPTPVVKENEIIPIKETKVEIVQSEKEPIEPVKKDIELVNDIVIEKDSWVVKKESLINKDVELLSAINPEIVLASSADMNFIAEKSHHLLALDNEDLSESLEKVDDTITSDALNTDTPLVIPDSQEITPVVTDEMTGTIIETNISTGIIQEVPLFKDIASDYKFYKELQYFKENNIIVGFQDGSFKPKNNITRIESLKIILLANQIAPVKDEVSKYSDIKTNSWENTYVNAAVKNKILSLDNKNFSPLRNVSRAEALKLILTLAKIDIVLDETVKIEDVDATDWTYKYANYALKNNLFEDSKNKFYPNKPINREELIAILYKIIKK